MNRRRKRRTVQAAASRDTLSRTYDKAAKELLATRSILAPVLQETVAEFRGLSLETIARDCIEQDPWISEVPVEPGRTNRRFRRRATRKLRGLATEQSERDEGYITFDLLFYARVPGTGERIKFLINIEAQRQDTNYSLLKRAIFYASRLISSQKERDFTGQDYDSICKVYTIWLCFYLPEGEESSMTHYELHEVNDIGSHREEKENYDLINVTTVHIGEDENPAKLLRFLRLVFFSRLSEEMIERKLEQDFGVKTDEDARKGLTNMCNLSEGIKEEGRAEGRAEGEARTWVASVRNIMKNMKLTAQQAVEAVAVPAQFRKQVLEQVE